MPIFETKLFKCCPLIKLQTFPDIPLDFFHLPLSQNHLVFYGKCFFFLSAQWFGCMEFLPEVYPPQPSLTVAAIHLAILPRLFSNLDIRSAAGLRAGSERQQQRKHPLAASFNPDDT